MKEKFIFPKRTIHLDYHTGTKIERIGEKFVKEEFAKTMKEAHVDSVTVFAMGHHGHLYYNTDNEARHPGLEKDFDLLKSQIDALHKEGIRAPIYLSVQCNEYCANLHPDWIALDENLRQVKRGSSAYTAGWQIMDMSSPYQDFLADILEEVLDKFAPVDGIFMDMCWDQPSSSKWAIEGMLKNNLNPKSKDDRSKYSRLVVHQYMKRYRDMVEKAHEKYEEKAGIWFNSRPKTNLHVEKKFLRHVEIEALPTGGWGYSYFPYVARFVRPLGLPTLSHTGRFFKSWGDNSAIKPYYALKYECCQILSQGMTNGVGDLLHPNGKLDKSVYSLIGKVYKHIEDCEPFMEDVEFKSQIALVTDPELGDHPGDSGIGLTRLLTQLRHQFDVISPADDFDKYEVIIPLESLTLDGKLKDKIEAYANKGGFVILSGNAAIDNDENPMFKEQGIEVYGLSPYSHTFLHLEDEIKGNIADYGHVMYEQGFRIKAKSNENSLITIGEPYFERDYNHFSGHSYTPEKTISDYSGCVMNGNYITFPMPIFSAYGKHAYPVYRDLVGNILNLIIKEPLIKTNASSRLETTVLDSHNRRIVHLLSFCPERRADGMDIVEDPIPVVDLEISVKSDKAPKKISLEPMNQNLEFSYESGYINTRVSFSEGHAMLVAEY